jgi:hypothetical protein
MCKRYVLRQNTTSMPFPVHTFHVFLIVDTTQSMNHLFFTAYFSVLKYTAMLLPVSLCISWRIMDCFFSNILQLLYISGCQLELFIIIHTYTHTYMVSWEKFPGQDPPYLKSSSTVKTSDTFAFNMLSFCSYTHLPTFVQFKIFLEATMCDLLQHSFLSHLVLCCMFEVTTYSQSFICGKR